MKRCKKFIVGVIMLVVSFSLTGCSMLFETPLEPDRKPIGSDPMSLSPEIFTYELTAKNWNTEGITVKYPLFVETNNQAQADVLNELIMADMEAVIEEITLQIPDVKGLTIDAIYDYGVLKNDLISISYEGVYFSENSAYPVNFYHTLTLDLAKGERVALGELFDIDNDFVQTFKLAYYVPYSEDLNLEDAGVNVSEAISEQYTDEELIGMFEDSAAHYYLQEDSIILSIPVPHAIGDHLEMAMLYEGFEENIRREHSYWKDYLYLTDNGLEDISSAGFVWQSYSNDQYNYTLSYPDIYENKVEPPAGDGIMMESIDGKYSLQIWAHYNIDESTAETLLEEAKSRYAYISQESVTENGYSLTFEGGGDEYAIQFVEECYVTPDAVVYYLISYPLDEAAAFEDVNSRMASELFIE